VIHRAEEVLATLETSRQSGALVRLADDLPLFSASRRPVAATATPAPLESALAEVHPDELTPKEALELIYRLKSLGGGA
jgi:DNA mismatch repair protein MutS